MLPALSEDRTPLCKPALVSVSSAFSKGQGGAKEIVVVRRYVSGAECIIPDSSDLLVLCTSGRNSHTCQGHRPADGRCHLLPCPADDVPTRTLPFCTHVPPTPCDTIRLRGPAPGVPRLSAGTVTWIPAKNRAPPRACARSPARQPSPAYGRLDAPSHARFPDNTAERGQRPAHDISSPHPTTLTEPLASRVSTAQRAHSSRLP